MWAELFAALWFIFPAWVANSFAINVSGIGFLKRYGYPVDGGAMLCGKRVLGDGKTWRGFIAGVLFAGLAGFLQQSTQAEVSAWYAAMFPSPIVLVDMTVSLAIAIGFGAMVGDMAGSFIKRQSGFDRGACVPLLDQLDYVFGTFVFAWPFVSLTWPIILWVLALTVPIHVAANIIAWKIKLKKVPW